MLAKLYYVPALYVVDRKYPSYLSAGSFQTLLHHSGYRAKFERETCLFSSRHVDGSRGWFVLVFEREGEENVEMDV